MRIGGFAGQVMAKLGVVPQQIAGGDIYPALEKGTIDAAEWVGPYDDQKLGFNKVAQYYYYPGWWEGGAALSLYRRPRRLTKRCRRSTRKRSQSAAADANVDCWSPSTTRRTPRRCASWWPAARKFLPFPQAVMEACFNAANELYAETWPRTRKFKKIYELVEAVPQRRGPVVPRRREHLRQLHGAPVGSQQALAPESSRGRSRKPRFGGAFSLRQPDSVAAWQADSAGGISLRQTQETFLGGTPCNAANSCVPPPWEFGGGCVCEHACRLLAMPRRSRRLPELKWRLASSFPKSLDTLYGGAETISQARRARRPTTSSRSASSPPARSCPACRWSTPCRTAPSSAATPPPYYFFGKDPAFAFDTARAVRHERAPAERVDVSRRRHWS